jgi:hypothetical protein
VGGVEREEMMHVGHIPDIESLAGSKIITLSWITSKSISKRQRRILPYCISCQTCQYNIVSLASKENPALP